MSKLKFIALLLSVLICKISTGQSTSYSSLYNASTFVRTTIDVSKEVGCIEGVAGTSPSGAATYSIPIKCPLGTAGIQPKLSIAYSSQNGNGELGQGWSIAGLSVITRAGKDIYHDGKVEPVTHSNEDAFLLDGIRLSVKTGSNGANGATYRTESESYAEITSYIMAGSLADSGPEKFKVVTKDGAIMEFGYNPDSRIQTSSGSKIMMWRLNKIQDINGNYIEFEYDNSERDSRIKEIRYTGNTGMAPYNRINFYYSIRDDKNTFYDDGSSTKSHYLLTGITAGEIATSDIAKSYSFFYGKNQNGTSFLKLVNEYNGNGESLNETRFKYGDDQPEISYVSSSLDIEWNSPASPSSTNYDIFSGDFDGDGKSEILKAQYNYVGSTFWRDRNYVGFSVSKESSATGSYSEMYGSNTSLTGSNNYLVSYQRNTERNGYNFVHSDFNGDGKDDILFMNITTDNLFGGVSIYYSNLGTSTPGFTKSDIPAIPLAGTHQMIGENILLTGDFDGDKRSDYMYITKHYNALTTTSYNHIHVSFPGKGELNKPIMYETIPTEYDQISAMFIQNDMFTSKVYVVDFDGDGVSEIVCSLTDGNMVYKLAKGSSGVYYFKKLVNYDAYPTERYQDIKGIGDFNGDGKSDLLVNSKADRNYWEIAYSTGIGWEVSPFSFAAGKGFQSSCTFGGGTDSRPDYLFIADYNGDGKSDILHKRTYCNSADYLNKTQFIFYTFIGKGIYNTKSVEYPYALTSSILPIVTDINGDGKSELSFKRLSLTATPQPYMQSLHYKKDDKSNFLEKINDGFNRTIEFDYQPLTKGTGTGLGDFYTKGSGESYPVSNGQYPIYVTTSMKSPDGIGGVNTTEFKYENFRLHRAGRGMLGFEKIRSINSISNIRTESLYELNRDFYVPYLKRNKTFLNSTGLQLSQTEDTVNFSRILTGYCFKQTIDTSVNQDMSIGSTTITVNIFDINGNLANSVATTNAGAAGSFISKTEATYTSTGMSIIPNKPNYTYISNKRGTMPETGIISYYYYNSKGNLSYLQKTPNISTIPTITIQKFLYDDFGNVKEKSDESAVGHIPSSLWPTTYYEYDTKGRFVVKETNPLGDFSTSNSDKFWGKPLSFTSFNGLNTTYTYNTWGKLISSTIPVTSTTTYVVNYSEDWDISGNQLFYKSISDPSSPNSKTWYDNSGREVRVQKEGFGGLTNSIITYNSKGGVASSTNNYYSTESPMSTTKIYDDRNRISSVTDYTGTKNYFYSEGDGYSTTTINLPDGKVSKMVTDFTGKLVKSQTNIVSKVVHFYYDSDGNEIKTRAGSFSTETHDLITKEYDGLGRLTKMKDPDAGTFTYEYDAFNNLKKQTDAHSVVTTFTYDKINRLVEKNVGGDITFYTYYGKLQDYRLKNAKVIFGPSTQNVEDNYEYAIGGGVLKHTRIALGNHFEKTFTYDGYGRLNTTEYLNSGFKKQNIYNSNGYLSKITTYMGSGVGEKTLYECTGMNGNGQVTDFKRVDGFAATTSYVNGFPTQYITTGKQNLVMGYNFANGNMSYRSDFITNTTESFTYDGADRLLISSAEKLGTFGGPPGMTHLPLTMTYDPGLGSLGQLSTKSDVGTYKYAYFPRNAVKTISDPTGVISHLTQDIFYRPFHKTGVIAENIGGIHYKQIFEYDADENRAYSTQIQGTTGGISGTGGTTKYKRWYFGDFEADNDIATSTTKMIHYISGSNGLCGMVVVEGGIFKYYGVYTDHLGSIVTVTDEASSGSTIAMQSYDAWGRERQPDTWGYIPSLGYGGIVVPTKPAWLYRGFTGHEMLPEYGLINMNGRMYDPLNGRMLSPDNYVSSPGNGQSYNRYSYALNNPLKFTDPDGNHPIIVAMAIGAALAASTYTYQVARSDNGFSNWNWGDFAMTTVSGGIKGAVAGGIGAGIGGIFGSTGTFINEVGRAGAHGLSNYLISGGQKSAFISGAFGSIAGSFGHYVGGPLNTTVGGTLFAAGVSGSSSAISGGNFWEGAAIGATLHIVNYLGHPDGDRNPKQDKPLSDGEIQKLKDNGWDHSDKGKRGGRSDLYKDRQGNVYQKPKGGYGMGEPLGINIYDLNISDATILVGAGIILYETIKWGGALFLAPETLGGSLVVAGAMP